MFVCLNQTVLSLHDVPNFTWFLFLSGSCNPLNKWIKIQVNMQLACPHEINIYQFSDTSSLSVRHKQATWDNCDTRANWSLYSPSARRNEIPCIVMRSKCLLLQRMHGPKVLFVRYKKRRRSHSSSLRDRERFLPVGRGEERNNFGIVIATIESSRLRNVVINAASYLRCLSLTRSWFY